MSNKTMNIAVRAFITTVTCCFWRHSAPSYLICLLAFGSLLLLVAPLVWRQSRVSGTFVLIGILFNGCVTLANHAVMPVVGMPATMIILGPIWVRATVNSHLLWLADQYSLFYFSVGDMFLYAGAILLLIKPERYANAFVAFLERRRWARHSRVCSDACCNLGNCHWHHPADRKQLEQRVLVSGQ